MASLSKRGKCLQPHFSFVPRPQPGPEAPDPHLFFTNGIKRFVTLCGSGQSPATAKQGFRIFKDTEYTKKSLGPGAFRPINAWGLGPFGQ